jgi:trimeric autotransporter adhesin
VRQPLLGLAGLPARLILPRANGGNGMRLGRRVLLVGLSALVAACTGVAASPAPRATPAHAAAVPWTATAARAAASPSTAAAAPQCTGADVLLSGLAFAGYGAGTAYYAGTATASTSCELPATTSAVLVDASGARIATRPGSPSGGVTAARGERLAVTLAVAPPCGLPSEPRGAQIALLGGSVVAPPIAADGQPHGKPCGAPTSTVTFTGAAATASATPAPQIDAAITASGPATPGTAYSYTVTLTNTSSSAWSLDPCPAYDEGVKIPAGYSESHLLNCAAATPLAAGASETFAMSLSIPADAPAGQSLLTWSIEGEGSGANAPITIN